MALLVSSSAFAQNFGEKGQLAISAERLFGYVHSSSTVSTNAGDQTWKTDSFTLLSSTLTASNGIGNPGLMYSQPRVAGDYFIIDHLSLGAALGYAHTSISLPVNGNSATTISTSGDSWTFAPRVGWSFMFADWVGIWPRGGFTYRNFSAGDNGLHALALTLEAPFTFTPIPHVVFTAGPTLDIGISGSSSSTQLNRTVSNDFSSTEIGIQTALIATIW